MLGTKVLEKVTSIYNGKITVVKTLGLGTYIQSEGLTQSGGVVETIWKSTLKRIRKENISSALIVGLGGGTVAKLLNKYFPNAKITGVDIDEQIVNLGKKYLYLDKFNVKTLILDALKFETKDKYDLIIVDVYNGDRFPKGFEDEVYINKLKRWLTSNGIIIFNRLYFGDKRPEAVRFGNKLEKQFNEVIWHYPQANLMFICKS